MRRIRPTKTETYGSQAQKTPEKKQLRKEQALPLRSGGLSGISSAQSQTASRHSIQSSFQLRLTNKDGETTVVPASNYYLDADGQPREGLEDLVDLILKRPPSAQNQIDARLTTEHARHEMSFKMKNPETGLYDKFFNVPSYGTVVPIQEPHFRMLVDSTGPVLRALRDVLQTLYTNPNATAEELGLEGLPPAEQQHIMDSIKGSLYFEPKLCGEEMADYPFLSVAGFDAAVGDLDNPEPVFFEYNLGTPSGFSNNVQLLETLREKDPALFKTIGDRLPEDRSFAMLRSAIESNAAKWTGNSDGISVVISPGPGSGAHPDVASLAVYSGMPLVHPSDLYEDAEGEIRLATEGSDPDPAVTGIYGRMEESYFLQESREGVPIRGPDFADAKEIGEKFGLDLEPGVAYDYIRDDNDEIVGVKTDENGQPQLQKIFESIGRDPENPTKEPGSFLRAIKNKKLYYSGLGGRVVDDKRVFQAIAQHVAGKHVENDGDPIARPPRTLDISEFPQFYETETPEKFVVKAPDNSGGVGVYLMCNLSPEERTEVIEKVKGAPEHYIVQEFAEPAVMTQAQEVDGEYEYGSSVVDWRLFIMMDGDGNVQADPQSVLVRAAEPFSASTNTSQGAGYAVGAILGEPKDEPGDVLPITPGFDYVGRGRMGDVRAFIEQLNWVINLTEPSDPTLLEGGGKLLAEFMRRSMDLVGRELLPAMTTMRAWDDGEIGSDDLHEALQKLRADLFASQSYPNPKVRATIHELIAAKATPNFVTSSTLPTPEIRAKVESALDVEPLPEPHHVSQEGLGGWIFHKFELATVKSTGNEFINSVVDELGAAGGELRTIRYNPLQDGSGEWSERFTPAYFRVNDDGNPIIGIDPAQARTMSALAHEREHFLLFQEHKDAFIAQGMTPKDAGLAAIAKVNETDQLVESEQRAVSAEFVMDETADSTWNRFNWTRPSAPTDAGFVTRMRYPEIEGVRDLLHRARWSDEPLDTQKLETYLAQLIFFAVKSNREAVASLDDTIALHARNKGPEARAAVHEAQLEAAIIKERSMFDTIFDPGSLDRFRTDQTLPDLEAAFAAAQSQVRVGQHKPTLS